MNYNYLFDSLIIAVIGFIIGFGLIGDGLLSRLMFGEWFYVTKRLLGWEETL